MNEIQSVTRRSAITIGGATVLGAGVAALAACTPGGATTGSDSGSSDAGSGSSGSGSGSTTQVKLSDVPVGGSINGKLGGQPILVAQPSAGKVVAFSAICTHQGCTVMAAGKEFDCPCHGSVYEAATGKVLQGPAPSPLPKLKATLSGDSITIS